MKKIIFGIFLIFFSFQIQAQGSGSNAGGSKKNNTSQNTNTISEMEKDARMMGDNLCECFNKIMKNYHPKTVEIITKIVELGEEKATEVVGEIMMQLSPDAQAQVMQDLQNMQKFDEQLKTECQDGLDKNLKGKYENQPNAEKEFLDYMMNYLASKESCKFTYNIMKLGLKKEMEDKE